MKPYSWLIVVGAVAGVLACQSQRSDVRPVANTQRNEAPEVSKGGAGPTTPSASAAASGAPATAPPTAQGRIDWINSRFMGRVTKERDATLEYRKYAGKGSAATPAELVKRITTAMTTPPQTEGKYEVEAVDVQVRGKVATSVLYACCELDDSVAGEQTLVTMQNRGAGWTVENAQARHLCYRGLNSDGTLCQ